MDVGFRRLGYLPSALGLVACVVCTPVAWGDSADWCREIQEKALVYLSCVEESYNDCVSMNKYKKALGEQLSEKSGKTLSAVIDASIAASKKKIKLLKRLKKEVEETEVVDGGRAWRCDTAPFAVDSCLENEENEGSRYYTALRSLRESINNKKDDPDWGKCRDDLRNLLGLTGRRKVEGVEGVEGVE